MAKSAEGGAVAKSAEEGAVGPASAGTHQGAGGLLEDPRVPAVEVLHGAPPPVAWGTPPVAWGTPPVAWGTPPGAWGPPQWHGAPPPVAWGTPPVACPLHPVPCVILPCCDGLPLHPPRPRPPCCCVRAGWQPWSRPYIRPCSTASSLQGPPKASTQGPLEHPHRGGAALSQVPQMHTHQLHHHLHCQQQPAPLRTFQHTRVIPLLTSLGPSDLEPRVAQLEAGLEQLHQKVMERAATAPDSAGSTQGDAVDLSGLEQRVGALEQRGDGQGTGARGSVPATLGDEGADGEADGGATSKAIAEVLQHEVQVLQQEVQVLQQEAAKAAQERAAFDAIMKDAQPRLRFALSLTLA